MTAFQGLELLVRKLETHALLAEDDRQAILALPHAQKLCEPGSYLVREGDVPDRCAVLLTGYAYRQKQTGEGLRQIVSLHIPGEATDFQGLFLDEADHSVQMMTRGMVAFVPRAEFQTLVRERVSISHAVLLHILVESSIFREWVLNVGRRDARSRMAHLLCEFAIRMQAQGLADDDGYELPITQEQLGDALGLTAVHVNRTLKALESEGLIKRNKRSVRFPAWRKLQDAGDFNPRYLHLEPQRAVSEWTQGADKSEV